MRLTEYQCDGCKEKIDEKYLIQMDCYIMKGQYGVQAPEPEVKEEVHFHNLDCVRKWLDAN